MEYFVLFFELNVLIILGFLSFLLLVFLLMNFNYISIELNNRLILKKNIFIIILYWKKEKKIFCMLWVFRYFLRIYFYNYFKFFCYINSFYSLFEEVMFVILGENSRMVLVSYILIFIYFFYINVYMFIYIR